MDISTGIDTAILQPVIALVAWSMLMWLWMYITRIPAIQKAKMQLDPEAVNGVQMSTLPAKVRWKADNYNHLMEQPTIFYATAISLALLGAGSGINLTLAWGYVGLRVVHSLVQSLVNKIEVRFAVFSLSSLLLIAMIFNAACLVF
ncbi:MAG: MAPEG family protein [Nevskiales bacterium]